jgi:hypothetical protein
VCETRTSVLLCPLNIAQVHCFGGQFGGQIDGQIGGQNYCYYGVWGRLSLRYSETISNLATMSRIDSLGIMLSLTVYLNQSLARFQQGYRTCQRTAEDLLEPCIRCVTTGHPDYFGLCDRLIQHSREIAILRHYHSAFPPGLQEDLPIRRILQT